MHGIYLVFINFLVDVNALVGLFTLDKILQRFLGNKAIEFPPDTLQRLQVYLEHLIAVLAEVRKLLPYYPNLNFQPCLLLDRLALILQLLIGEALVESLAIDKIHVRSCAKPEVLCQKIVLRVQVLDGSADHCVLRACDKGIVVTDRRANCDNGLREKFLIAHNSADEREPAD